MALHGAVTFSGQRNDGLDACRGFGIHEGWAKENTMPTKPRRTKSSPSSRRRVPKQHVVLGIDVGGTGIKAAPVDVLRGKLLQKRIRVRTPGSATPGKVASVVDQLTNHFHWKDQVGCGMPCLMDQEIIKSGNLSKRWIGKNPTTLFRAVTSCHVTVMNDADAAGLAEIKFGAGRRCTGTVLMVTIGTGIGMSLFREGHLVPNTEVVALIPKETKLASDRARRKEGLRWKRWAKRLNRCLGLLEEALSPDLIILGGGISKKYERYGKYLKTKAALVPAFYRGNAGIVGAAVAAANSHLLIPSMPAPPPPVKTGEGVKT